MKKILICFLAVTFTICFVSGGFSQNLIDDVVNNNLEGLKKKAALLNPTFKESPFLDIYFSQAQAYSQDMTDYLIANGADVNQVDQRGLGPLYYAIKFNRRGAFDKLISLKVNVNIKWKSDAATIEGPDKAMSQLGTGLDPDARARFDRAAKKQYFYGTPLWAAVEAGNTYMVQTLLNLGADPLVVISNYLDKTSVNAKTPKYISENVLDTIVDRFSVSSVSSVSGLFVQQQRLDPEYFVCGNLVWQAVLKLPAKKQPQFEKERVSNVFAYCVLNDIKSIKGELLKTGANTVDFVPYAVLAKNWDVVDLIYKYNGFQIDQPAVDMGDGTGRKETVMQWAVTNDYIDAVKFLKDNGVALPETVSFTNTQGQNVTLPLIGYALAGDRTELVRYLIDQKTDLNAGGPLRYCVSGSPLRELLLSSGADINATFALFDSTTPVDYLFSAAADGNLEAVSYFLSKGIDPNRSPQASPLIMAICKGQPEIVEALLKAKANRDAVVSNPAVYKLRGGANKNALFVAKALMDHGYDFDLKEKFKAIFALLGGKE